MSSGPYRCEAEGCPVTRDRDSNHWLIMRASAEALHIYRWTDAMAKRAGSHLACGQNCCSILMARWMSQKTLEVVRN